MLKRTVLIFPLLVSLLQMGAQAEATASQTVNGISKKDVAEIVFGKAAPKVVFLITRKSGELYARASGVILSADGYIGTNFHALQGADTVEIRYFPNPENSNDYHSFNAARLVHLDPERDIAILKVNSSSLPFLGIGAEPRVGQIVYAIGNPKGLSNTISEGIVSALRSAPNEEVIQHTAAISPGSSGGALVDSNGGFLGINSWQVTDAQNLNFAISAKHVWEALAAARQATTSLDFPPDSPAHDSEPAAGKRWKDSQPVVAALRAIASTIKECPRIVWFEESSDEKRHTIMTRSRVYFGPPINVVWDVTPSESVRSPYTGYVEFTIPRSFWVPNDIYDKYSKNEADSHLLNTLLKPVPNLMYRYEFDIGPDGLQLVRMLFHPADETGWKDEGKEEACSQVGCVTPCWQAAGQTGQIISNAQK